LEAVIHPIDGLEATKVFANAYSFKKHKKLSLCYR
jgi:hypothetical protein